MRCERCGYSFLCRDHAHEAEALVTETRYYCDEAPPGFVERNRALAAARDEVIAAAREVNALLDMMRDDDLAGPASGNPYGLTPSAGKLLKIRHDALRAAVATLKKLEGK